jgi:chemotaxis protein CheC
MTDTEWQLNHLQLDALREVANIASGHAATALGRLTDTRIMIRVPTFAAVAVEELPAVLGYAEEPVVVVAMHMLGDLTGALVFLLPQAKACRLSELLLRRPVDPVGALDALARSSIIETGNILGGAYTGALSVMISGSVMLSVPTFGIEPPHDVLASHGAFTGDARMGVCIGTELTVDRQQAAFSGHLLMLPRPAALRAILAALRV